MGRNVPIVVTSFIVVALLVLLVYPAIIPINAPPVLKTFKDVFVAVLTVAIALTSVDLLPLGRAEAFADENELTEDVRSRLCTLRC